MYLSPSYQSAATPDLKPNAEQRAPGSLQPRLICLGPPLLQCILGSSSQIWEALTRSTLLTGPAQVISPRFQGPAISVPNLNTICSSRPAIHTSDTCVSPLNTCTTHETGAAIFQAGTQRLREGKRGFHNSRPITPVPVVCESLPPLVVTHLPKSRLWATCQTRDTCERRTLSLKSHILA